MIEQSIAVNQAPKVVDFSCQLALPCSTTVTTITETKAFLLF
jgi:hypothetical protein